MWCGIQSALKSGIDSSVGLSTVRKVQTTAFTTMWEPSQLSGHFHRQDRSSGHQVNSSFPSKADKFPHFHNCKNYLVNLGKPTPTILTIPGGIASFSRGSCGKVDDVFQLFRSANSQLGGSELFGWHVWKACSVICKKRKRCMFLWEKPVY